MSAVISGLNAVYAIKLFFAALFKVFQHFFGACFVKMAVSENSKSGKKFLDRFRVQSTGKNEHETKEILLAEMFSVSEVG